MLISFYETNKQKKFFFINLYDKIITRNVNQKILLILLNFVFFKSEKKFTQIKRNKKLELKVFDCNMKLINIKINWSGRSLVGTVLAY